MRSAVKTDVTPKNVPDTVLSNTAEAMYDEIKAEPVPSEIMELALRLQAKVDARIHAPEAVDGGHGSEKA